MPNLCPLCGSQVSYFGRRFAHHRWFCDSDCLRRWETETQQADSAAHSGATERHRLSRRQIIIRGAVFTGIAVAIGVLVITFIVLADPYCVPTVGEVDRANEEVLASLPPYPGATLIQKHRFSDVRFRPDIFGSTDRVNFRTLTHVYAYPAGSGAEEILAFYRVQLRRAGWELRLDEFDNTYFWKDSGSLDLVGLGADLRPLAPAPEALLAALSEGPATPVAKLPSGSVTLLAISVAREAR